MTHFQYFLGLALFILGNSFVIYYGRLCKTYRFRFLKFLFLNMFFSLLIVILQIGKLYTIVNISHFFPLFSFIQIPLAGILIILLMSSYSLLVLNLYEEDVPRSRKAYLFVLTLFVIMSVLAGNIIYLIFDYIPFLMATEYVYAAALVLASLLLILDKNISANSVNRRILRLFGIFSLIWCSTFLLHLLVPLLPSLYLYLFSQAAQFIFPYVWFKYFFLEQHTLGISCLRDRGCLDRIFQEKKITGREREIIELIVQGKSNREIEKELYISIYTVKNHVQNIYAKLGVRSRAKLIHMVIESQRLITT